jgi:hypothetical protein
MPTQVKEASRIPNRHDENRTSPQHIIVKNNKHKEQGKNTEDFKGEIKSPIEVNPST